MMSRYVVGYAGKNQCVYGKDKEDGTAQFADPFTLKQAKKERNRFIESEIIKIFKLVAIKENK